MRYLALACDYDGTLAEHGAVEPETLASLVKLKASGRMLVLVTGRELTDLARVFPHLDLFDRVVVENGAILFRPETHEEIPLAEPPHPAFMDALVRKHVVPLSNGRVIVASRQPSEVEILETIRELGLELQVIFNKGAVMVLPSGINKGSGLKVALTELGLSPHNTVGVGDGENDHAFLSLCECAVAVANALPLLKERADVVTVREDGAGVQELVDQVIADDLASVEPALRRHDILLGTRADGQPCHLAAYGSNVLLCGTSGGGKSTLATGVLERLDLAGYQYCLVDPEGDHESLPGSVVLGTAQSPPSVNEAIQVLCHPTQQVCVNLLGLALADRPRFFGGLFTGMLELRSRTGRPHLIAVDEAHHLLPAAWDPAVVTLPRAPKGLLFITVHPELISPDVLSTVDTVIGVGNTPETTLQSFAQASRTRLPPIAPRPPKEGPQACVWQPGHNPFWIKPMQSRAEHLRHRRKYAEGELGPDRSFYFRGPEGKLKLRAHNLSLFMQMADGVDEETWRFHLLQQDYSRWFREAIKDPQLAEEAERVEAQPDLPVQDSRARIRTAIEQRYTLPA